ncbi:hypothetical protein TNCV_1844381 [Trichonephila clavipes]|nr:hypothetical protein TNCV_1844381 [Trichonephila clavipes]
MLNLSTKELPLARWGSWVIWLPSQVSSTSLDRGLKLRGQSSTAFAYLYNAPLYRVGQIEVASASGYDWMRMEPHTK